MAETSPPANPVRSRYLLLLLMLIPIGVVLLATLVFYTRIGMPDGTRNKGVLITPPLQLNETGLKTAQGEPYILEAVKEKMWTFLVANPSHCDEICRKHFWEIRQTRIALGKHQGHIQRIWLVTEGVLDAATQQWLTAEHPDVVVLYVDGTRWRELLKQSPEGIASEGKAVFFLGDPRGFIMMYYTPQDTYRDVITDMKFLLKGVE
jgi:hypothetical protein